MTSPVPTGPVTARPDTDDEADAGPGVRVTLLGWWRQHPRAVVAAAVGLACGIAWAGWTASRLGNPDVTWQVYGYRVMSESTTRVTVLVTRDRDAGPVVCRMKALDKGFTEVGSLEVDVPPSDADTVRITVDVPTTRLAVTGLVDSCAVRGR